MNNTSAFSILPFARVRMNTRPQFYRCAPGWEWKPKSFKDYDLWYVAKGIGQVRIGDREYALGAGSCFVFQPEMALHATQDSKERLLVFGVHFDFLDTRRRVIRISSDFLPEV